LPAGSHFTDFTDPFNKRITFDEQTDVQKVITYTRFVQNTVQYNTTHIAAKTKGK